MATGSSGLPIYNQATVDYQVGSVNQPTISSNNYQFRVDTKIDVLVEYVNGGYVSVIPGSTYNVQKFKVTNQGNKIQDFRLTVIASATDDIDADTISLAVESDPHDTANSSYDGSDIASYIDELEAGSFTFVYVLADFDTGYDNGDIAAYDLKATAAVGASAASLGADEIQDNATEDNESTVQVVFGDSSGSAFGDTAKDGIHSARGFYQISSAALTMIKSSRVISDPVNGTVKPKRIPGAIVEYKLVISNAAGAATANNIRVLDSLNHEISTNNTLALKSNAWGGNEIWIDHPFDANDGTLDAMDGLTGDTFDSGIDAAQDGVMADFGITSTNTLTVTGISLDASQSATIKFQVTIEP